MKYVKISNPIQSLNTATWLIRYLDTLCLLFRFCIENGRKVLGSSDITANLYSNWVYLYWEGCVIYSIYLR